MINILGTIAGVLTTISFLPQVYRIYTTRQTHDLSLSMFLLFTLGVLLWLIYGIMIFAIPIIAANSVTLILSFYILIMKIRLG